MMKTRLGALAVLAAFWAPACLASGEACVDTAPTAIKAEAATAAIPAKSAKRGVAYDLAAPADLQALSPGVSWWYN